MKRYLLLIFMLVSSGILFAQTQIVHSEYWFDSDLDTKELLYPIAGDQPIFSADLDISMLSMGLHTVSFRFSDTNKSWSPAYTHFFFITTPEDTPAPSSLTKWEYWFDSNTAETFTGKIQNQEQLIFLDNIDPSSLSKGLHTFHMRYADSNGRWSSAISKFFIIKEPISVTGENALIVLEYWFDKGEEIISMETGPAGTISFLSDLDVSTLQTGLHTFNFRFRDQLGNYSQAGSNYFVCRQDVNTGRELTAYRYWFSDSLVVSAELQANSEQLVFLQDIDMRLIEKGEYILHMQFKDNSGAWSGTLSDTVNKLVYPYALLSSSGENVCVNDSLEFHARIIDADSIAWNFNDNALAFSDTVKHSWNTTGEYVVSATLTDRQSGQSYTAQLDKTIKVLALPLIDLGDNVAFCMGEEASLSGPEGMASYHWDNGAYGQSIIVASEGSYYLVVQDYNGCINIDSVNVVVHALPIVDLGSDRNLCFGEVESLEGPSGSYTYEWNTTETEQNIIVSTSGTYILHIEDLNACSNMDTVHVSVHDLPPVDLGEDIELINDESYALDAGSDYVSYFWNGTEGEQLFELSADIQGFGEHSIALEVTDIFGCVGSDTIQVNILLDNSIPEEGTLSLRYFPNPAKDWIILEWPETLSARLILIDMKGRVLDVNENVESGSKLDLSMLEPGQYLIRLELAGKMLSLPLVKQ